jgi:hypothetical protein
MAQSKTTEELLALGGALVEEFNLREDHDTLGLWIAHHLAEKLKAHKIARGSTKRALEAEIVDIILQFWKHRAFFPRGNRPFENYEAVLRALESFDPDLISGRYFNFGAADDAAKGSNPASEQWIDIAKQIDRGARAIVNFCIRNAATAAEKPGDAWLAVAKVLPENRDFDISIIKNITENDRKDASDEKAPDPAQMRIDSLKRTQKDLLRLIGSGNAVYQVIENSLEASTGKSSKATPKKGSSKRSVPSSNSPAPKGNAAKAPGRSKPSNRAKARS